MRFRYLSLRVYDYKLYEIMCVYIYIALSIYIYLYIYIDLLVLDVVVGVLFSIISYFSILLFFLGVNSR